MKRWLVSDAGRKQLARLANAERLRERRARQKVEQARTPEDRRRAPEHARPATSTSPAPEPQRMRIQGDRLRRLNRPLDLTTPPADWFDQRDRKAEARAEAQAAKTRILSPDRTITRTVYSTDELNDCLESGWTRA